MKWFRALLIIGSIGAVVAGSTADDGALGHRRGGGSDDRGKQSGGGDVRSQGDSGVRTRDRDNQNGGGSSIGSFGGQRDTGRDRDRIGGDSGNRDSNRGGTGTLFGGQRDNGRERGSRNDDRITIGGGTLDRGEFNGNLSRQGGRDEQTDPFNKRKPGSSGTVVYGTANNLRSDPAWAYRPFERERPPVDVFNPSLTTMVRREDNVVRSTRYRTGYYHYSASWRDDDFYFGYYYFRPAYDRCVVSPFYYYPFLPPYVSRSRVLVLRVGNVSIYADDGPNYYWDRAVDYRWSRDYWWDFNSRRSDLDLALDDLVSAWENANRRALDRLIPSRGTVGIYVDERYNYSLDVDDFYDMLLDNILSARTRKFDILSVKTYRNEARVVAVHEYIDPWNRRDRVYHVYRLVRDGYRYVITDFGTSDRRPRR